MDDKLKTDKEREELRALLEEVIKLIKLRSDDFYRLLKMRDKTSDI